MPRSRILILGGTREARELASALGADGYAVTTSLAGATKSPLLPEGEVRTGGFGGAEGLAQYIRMAGIALVADATHPFAARMSAHAHEACRSAGVPLLRLERPAWVPQAGDRWTNVSSAAEAAERLPKGACALVTIGRKEISPFLARSGLSGVARMIEPPADPFPPGWTLLLDRPPFSLAAEREVMTRHDITHLVSKNAGGTETSAKIEAARSLSIPVIMIARPHKPEVETCATVAALQGSIHRLLLP